EQHLGLGAEEVEQRVLALGQPRQPRLHAVERRPFGQPLPLLPPPWLLRDQARRPLAHVVGGQELTARKELGALDVNRGALVGHGELGETVDLVAPQVDTDGNVGGGREDVDDRASDRDLSAVLDLVLAAVTGGDELFDELGRVEYITRMDDDGLDILYVRPQSLHEGPYGCDE